MKKITHILWIMFLFGIIHFQAKAQIELVADLAEGTESQIIELSGEWDENLFILGDQLLFILEDHPLYGTELWRMGTDEQVTLVTDLLPGLGNGLELTTIAIYNEHAYFLGTNAQGIHSLYQTDGTEEGTVLIKELYDTKIEGLYYSHVVNDKLLLQISVAEGNQDIWVTDGTSEGTLVLSEEIYISNAVNIENLAIVEGYDETNGTELWVTDGTTDGTNLLKDINNGTNSSYPTEFYSSSFGVIFRAQTAEEGEEIWVTDGTSLGTELFAEIIAGSESGQPRNFIEFDNQIFFQAREVGGVSGNELWKSDGTALGTSLVKDIFPGGVGSSVEDFYVFDGSLYFSAQGNSTLFEPYKSDGTDAGTVLVKDINTSGNSNPKAHFEIDGTHYFFAYDNAATGIWTTDGTEGGTTLIKHLYDKTLFPSNIKSSTPPILFNGSYYFNISSQLYKTDGTEEGTVEIYHSIDVPKDSDPLNFIETPLGTFFAAFVDGDPHLFITDGLELTDLSEAGFILDGEPGEINSDFIFYNNKLIFSGYTDTEGLEPWITDGTVAGTHMIKDVNTIDLLGGPGAFFKFNDKVYFSAKNAGSSDFELFVTDGTEEGTSLVKDINSGISASSPNNFGIIGDKMYFEAFTSTYGNELWESDGTDAGTQQVVDLRVGNPGAVQDIQIYFNDKVFFTAYVDAGIGTELYVSDGTEVGTELLYDIQAGGSNGQIEEGTFVQVGTKLVFTAYDGTIWSTEGTTETTLQILNDAYTETLSYRYSVGLINNKYVFVAQDNDNDVYYLFATDGTIENTVAIASDLAYNEDYINRLPENDNIIYSSELDGKIYFSTGAGMFATDGTLAGTSYFDTDKNGTGFTALYPTASSGGLYFSGFEEGGTVETLFKSDGTAAGTILIENNGVAVKGPLESIGDYVYFGGYDFEYGTELYRFNTTLDFQEITFAAIPDQFLANETLTLNATSSSELEVTYEIVSGPATVSGNVITFTGLGIVTVKANQAGNGSFHPAVSVEQSFEVLVSDQSITFEALDDQLFSNGTLTLGATASSGLEVVYEIVSGPATVSGNVVTFTDLGLVTVSATQTGNDAYNSAVAVEQSFTVFKNEQTITFAALADQLFSNGTIELVASSSSELGVAYEVVSGPATVSGNVITFTDLGDVTVVASQAGNDAFLAADPVEQSFTIFKNEQLITFSAIDDQFFEAGSLALSATASSGLDVSFEILSGSATVNGNIVSFSDLGTVVVSASQAGDDSFLPATSVEQSFEIITVTGVDDDATTLLIYPNPTSDVLTVQTQQKNTTLMLLNIRGSEVMAVKPNESNDISQLDNGIYFLRISNTQGTTTHKIIKN